ncbi:archaellum component FlaC/predicted metal-binding transcription factor (methanogenesis marker protein 9) [Haloferula luteola]|uniref:Archaellum component FlaC/predicted metal-binding transcription factor (Methanogenesis marker protein 9) n=1 Tax=Haloferula luteola TaxID=595692 RepID=A0A840UZZ9_9BACT|nr:hypothetical protein [Haloferula luteola]MBB5351342.1 archaellum component FlaC/predicted metal-binding transcription factor (methanogenesis marker protein 9) [Haloferula luteola]
MANDKDFKIGIKTTADTKGAASAKEAVDELNRSLEVVEKTEQERNAHRAQFLTAAEREVAEVERIAASYRNQTKEIESIPEESSQAARSIDALEQEVVQLQRELMKLDVGSQEFLDMVPRVRAAETALADAATEARRLGATITSSSGAGGVRNFGALAQQAGYQVGDFAVQVGMGTNAMTAFAQQGSQLLGFLGPGGALAGAALAIGAAIYGAMSRAKDGAEEAGDSIEGIQERWEQLDETWKKISNDSTVGVFQAESTAIDIQTEAIQRNIQKRQEFEEQAGKLDKNRTEFAVGELERQAATGLISQDEASARVSALRERFAEREIARLERVGRLDVERFEAEAAAAVAKKNNARQALEDAQIAKAQAEALSHLVEDITNLSVPATYVGAVGPAAPSKAQVDSYNSVFADVVGRLKGTGVELSDQPLLSEIKSLIPTLQKQMEDATLASETETKAAENLSKAVEDLRQASIAVDRAQNAADDAVDLRRSQQVNEVATKNANVANAGISEVEQMSGELIAREIDKIVSGLVDGANSPVAKEAQDKINEILRNGFQAGESDQLLQLIQQLSSQIGDRDANQVAAYRAAVDALGAAENAIGTAHRSMERATSSLTRRIEALEQSARNPNP